MIRNRVPKGQRAGGRFAPASLSESDVEITPKVAADDCQKAAHILRREIRPLRAVASRMQGEQRDRLEAALASLRVSLQDQSDVEKVGGKTDFAAFAAVLSKKIDELQAQTANAALDEAASLVAGHSSDDPDWR